MDMGGALLIAAGLPGQFEFVFLGIYLFVLCDTFESADYFWDHREYFKLSFGIFICFQMEERKRISCLFLFFKFYFIFPGLYFASLGNTLTLTHVSIPPSTHHFLTWLCPGRLSRRKSPVARRVSKAIFFFLFLNFISNKKGKNNLKKHFIIF